MRIDLTGVVQAVIALLAALVTYKLIPWIRSKTTEQQFTNLEAAARVAVFAAEQIFKNGNNVDKLEYATDQIIKAGFDLDIDTIRAAIEQACYDLKKDQQITLSLKQNLESNGTSTDYDDSDDDDDDEDYRLPLIKDWPLDMLQTFCEDNGIPCNGCWSKEDYIRAITKGEDIHPPDKEEQTE